jgi:hypothetical protein
LRSGVWREWPARLTLSVSAGSLNENLLGPEGAQMLADALATNTHLAQLYLFRNKLGDTGAAHMARLLRRNTALRGLHLAYNGIGAAGGTALGQSLAGNTQLTSLNLFAGFFVCCFCILQMWLFLFILCFLTGASLFVPPWIGAKTRWKIRPRMLWLQAFRAARALLRWC